MTLNVNVVPDQLRICDDRPLGDHMNPVYNDTPPTCPPSTKWASRVHGNVYVDPWIFGSSRSSTYNTWANHPNRNTTAKEWAATVVRVRHDNYDDIQWVNFPIAGVAGEYWGYLENIIYARGSLWTIAVTRYVSGADVTDLDGMRTALIRINPASLSWEIVWRSPIRLVPDGTCSDGDRYYWSSLSKTDGSIHHGICRIDFDTFTFTSQAYWTTNSDHGTGTTGITEFANVGFHSLVVDDEKIYGCYTGNLIDELIPSCWAIDKETLHHVWVTHNTPMSTDDMTQSDEWVFFGNESQFNIPEEWPGRDIGNWACRKSDGAYRVLPRYGPEDFWSNDVNENRTSYSSTIFGKYLMEVKSGGGYNYVLDISDVENWSMDADMDSILLVRAAIDMSAIENLRRFQLEGTPPGDFYAVNEAYPNELMISSTGKIHSFCWAYPFPITLSVPTVHQEVSSLIGWTIPGFDFRDPPKVNTIAATNVNKDAKSVTLNGDITSIGGAAIEERGFYYGTVNPPATRVVVDGVTPGTFSHNLSGLPQGTYYFRSFAKNDVGESLGSVLSFDLTSTAPLVSSQTPDTNPDAGTALLKGNVSGTGGSPITERGFYFGTVNPPDTRVIVPGGLGIVALARTGLLPFVTYFFRVFAKNEIGESVGDVVSFFLEGAVTPGAARVRFLVVDGLPIPVEPDSNIALQFTPIGDSDWSIDGEPISDISGYRSEIPVSTKEMNRNLANQIRDKVMGEMPVLCWGALLGATYECDLVFQELRPTALSQYQVSFLIRVGKMEEYEQVAGISVSPSRPAVNVDGTIHLTAEASDSTGNVMATVWSWDSSDVSVATVDDDGDVVGVSPGIARITATSSNGLSTSVEVTVV